MDSARLASRVNLIGPWLKKRFGTPVVKIGLDAGLGCPNRDGTLGTKGCRFCPPGGAGHRPLDKDVIAQLQKGMKRLRTRAGSQNKSDLAALAYFQAFTGTHGPPELLEKTYLQALSVPNVAGLIISTRPDCLDEPRWEVLQKMARRTPLWIELGIQSAHDPTLRALGRGHDVNCFDRAVSQAHKRDIQVVAHVILGLPGETVTHTNATADHLARLGVWGVKMHNLMVLDQTRLASDFRAGSFAPWSLKEWAQATGQFLARLSGEITIHRLAADPGPDRLVAPLWAGHKDVALSALADYLEANNLRQGDLLS